MSARGAALKTPATCALPKRLPASRMLSNRAVLGALTWQQLRRWQDRPSAAEAPAEGKKARRPASIDIDAQAQAIVDAAEDDAQQHGCGRRPRAFAACACACTTPTRRPGAVLRGLPAHACPCSHLLPVPLCRTHIVGSSANLPDLSGGAGSTSGGSSRDGSPAAADPPPVAQQQAAMERAAHAIVDATEEDRK